MDKDPGLASISRIEFRVVMPYIGGVLSENAYKFTTRKTKPFVKMWMIELADKIKALDIPRCGEYVVEVRGRFTDERRPDISNLFKVILDAIQMGLGVNDKNFKAEDKGYTLGHWDPELEITVIPVKDDIHG